MKTGILILIVLVNVFYVRSHSQEYNNNGNNRNEGNNYGNNMKRNGFFNNNWNNNGINQNGGNNNGIQKGGNNSGNRNGRPNNNGINNGFNQNGGNNNGFNQNGGNNDGIQKGGNNSGNRNGRPNNNGINNGFNQNGGNNNGIQKGGNNSGNRNGKPNNNRINNGFNQNGGDNNGIQKGDNNSGRPNNNPAKCQQIFESRMLKLHNDLRSMHQVSPLRFDKKLKIAAESLTKRMVLSKTLSIEGDASYGANKFASSMSKLTDKDCKSLADRIFNSFAESETSYRYDDPGFTTKTGGFTQLVWKASTRIGCSISFTDLSKLTKFAYGVCYYSPRGNIVGLFDKNVLSKVRL